MRVNKSDLIKLAQEISHKTGINCDIDQMFSGYRFVKLTPYHMRDILQTGHTERKDLYDKMSMYLNDIDIYKDYLVRLDDDSKYKINVLTKEVELS